MNSVNEHKSKIQSICCGFIMKLGQLRAKEDIHRQQAASVIKGLADHFSDPHEMAELIKYLFGVLGGKFGL